MDIIFLQNVRKSRNEVRTTILRLFGDIDWQVNLKNECIGIAKPTPKSIIFENAGIDTFPVKETLLKWATLIARR